MENKGSNNPPNERFEQTARALQAQVHAWMAAKLDSRSETDSGVPVVRRRRMSRKLSQCPR